ncbi:MAG: GAF domain-containing protein [Myxococcales bacterium]|nr:GAF domain-containing protein [Myxococcales bacterium]
MSEATRKPGEPDAAALAPPRPDGPARVAALERALGQQEERLAGLVRIAASLNSTRDPSKAMRAMVAEISTLLEADRTTIYELRPDDNMLRGLAVQGAQSLEVGVPVGAGIAGMVAASGKPINLKDAYLHPRFDPKFDKLTGYRTRSMLVVPMRNPKREVIGVVQVLNKLDGYFSVEDEHLLAALAAQAAITLEALHLQLRLNISNAELREASRQLEYRVRELELLYDNERAMADAHDEEALVGHVLQLAAKVARCEMAGLFLPDPESGIGPAWLRTADPDAPLTPLCDLEVGDGVLGKAASRGHALVLARPADFTAEAVPPHLGGTCAVLVRDAVAAPLVDGGRTIGSLALINRRSTGGRNDEEDRRLAVLLGGQIARAVARIQEQASAQQRDRMMTIGQMLSGVLHDLRGPMAIISGYTQLMADTDDADDRSTMAAHIRRQVNLFNDMTREVMSFVRGERSVLVRKVFVDKFVAAVRETLQPEFTDRGITFEVDNQGLDVAFFDEPKMMRVVTNIARNARQAMGQRGAFTWRLRRGPAGETVFELEDTGPGIPEHIRDRLFETFTTSGKADGTGLGLAIVRRIVEDHQGTVSFHTETGRGTTFTIVLPAPPETAAAAA